MFPFLVIAQNMCLLKERKVGKSGVGWGEKARRHGMLSADYSHLHPPTPDPCGSSPGLRAHVVLLPQAVPRTSTLDVSVCSWAQWAMGGKGGEGGQTAERTD